MNANDAAVLALMTDAAGADGCVRDLPRAAVAQRLGIAESTVQLALGRLVAAGALAVERSKGRGANTYCLGAVQPTDPTDRQPTDEPTDRPSEPTESVAAPLAGSTAPETNLSSLPPHGSGSSPARAPEPTEPTESVEPTESESVVEIGQAVVAWAVDEQRRLDKPPLDGALLAKLGSTAKRMSDDVSPADLKLAVEYLVARDMTALDAAHRKVQAAVGREASGERAMLSELASRSRGARDPRSFDPHRDDELVEAWAFLAATWYREPLPGDDERAAWHEGLRAFPMDCILWALTMIARRGDRFRPTWGQVYAVAAPKYKDAITLWRATEQADRMRRATEGDA